MKQLIGLFSRHRIKLTNSRFPINDFSSAQIWIEAVDETVQRFIREAFIDSVGGVHIECKGQHRRFVQLLQASLDISGIADFDVFRKGGVRHDVDDPACFWSLFVFHQFSKNLRKVGLRVSARGTTTITLMSALVMEMAPLWARLAQTASMGRARTQASRTKLLNK